MTKKIVVAGDVTIDWLQWEIKPEEEKKTSKKDKKLPLNWELYSGYNMVARTGGACLLAQMIDEALNNGSKEKKYSIISHDPAKQLSDDPENQPKKIEDISSKDIIHSITILGEFNLSEKNKEKVYRVKEFCGFSGPKGESPNILSVVEDNPEAEIVVIDDAGNGFRDEPSAWPEAIKNKTEILESADDELPNPELTEKESIISASKGEKSKKTGISKRNDKSKKPTVVYKMSRPLVKGKLWENLKTHYNDNLVVIISANDLREIGVNISRRLSWEKTAQDFMWQIMNNTVISDFKECKNLIVRLGIDGAIHYTNNNGQMTADLFFDPKCMEDGFRDNTEGDMQGYGNAFVSAIVKQIAENGFKCMEDGITTAILSARKLLTLGFGNSSGKPCYPSSEIFIVAKDKNGSEEDKKENKEVKKQDKDENDKKCKCTDNDTISHITIPNHPNREKYWTILESRTKHKLEEIANDFVIKGFDNLDDSISGIPLGKFKGLKTVDRAEIEGYQSIRNLMKEYLERDDPKSPLCIAVFGPPGSGKSFGVKQLAKSIPGAKIKKIGFNVAQFESQKDLIDALQKVRDDVLKGFVPLVFFDEFDAKFEDEKLGWLKYFLAPMQDCKFKHGETMHPIGKSIFVFAGGTSSSFEEFSREKLTKDDDKNLKNEYDGDDKTTNDLQDFIDAKGTDFASRLRGYVNVMGPNRINKEDNLYIIRRAIFLRSLLERKAKNILNSNKSANIDRGVLKAFLLVPEYKHGVRSMEAIIEMSMLADRKQFEQAALPSARQLEMHVDSDIFSKLVLREVLFEEAVEKLAKEIHEQYRKDQWKNYPPSDPSMQPWDKLKENLKESNRQQAKDIPDKLRLIDYDYIPALEKVELKLDITEKQLEFLAKKEHDRWMDERFGDKWSYGKPRNVNKKISPYLVPWGKLKEHMKDIDRNAILNIPKFLEKAGFEVYPLK